MNETILPDGASDAPWRTADQRARLSDTPARPDIGSTPPASFGTASQAAQGAHDAIDQVADRAASAARNLDERVDAAKVALHEKTDQLRETKDEWVDGLRANVRSRPLAAVSAALVLGLVMARITR